ncbi:helix-turn-helix domain-containing protein [Saccharothrix sp. AJ9571]|nr:helix-turn-helix domain-containing protein [Saccharothrix sp. AJ9571]
MPGEEEFRMALRALMRRQRRTQASLARELDVSVSYLSKLLTGQRPMTPALVDQFDTALHAGGRLSERSANAERLGRPQQLPAISGDLIGRTEILHRLDQALSVADPAGPKVPTIVIEGAPGVGKSATQLHLASRISWRFGGGCLYADFAASSVRPTRAEVLLRFLSALGEHPGRDLNVDVLAERFHTATAGHRVLVVLDNVTSVDEVRALTPAAGGAALISTRSGPVTMGSNATHVVLPPLAQSVSYAMLAGVVGVARMEAEPVAARRLVASCGGLPASIRAVGEGLRNQPHRSLTKVAAELRSTIPVDPEGRFGEAYRSLGPMAASVFRLVGGLRLGPLTEDVIVALVGKEGDVVRQSLRYLLASHLIDQRKQTFDLAAPLREFAAIRAADEDGDEALHAALIRLLRWFVAASVGANDLLAPAWDGGAIVQAPLRPAGVRDYRSALSWCQRSAWTAVRLARRAEQAGLSGLVWKLALAFMPYFYLTKAWEQWLRLGAMGVSAARQAGDPVGLGRSLHSLGWAQLELRREPEARQNFGEALPLLVQAGDDRGLAWVLLGLGGADSQRGEVVAAIQELDKAAHLFLKTGLPFGAAVARSLQGRALDQQNDVDALPVLTQALELAITAGIRPTEGLVRHLIGEHYLAKQEFRLALVQLDRALALRRATGERWAEADVQLARSDAFNGIEDAHSAQSALEAAVVAFDELRDPRALEARARLAAIRSTGLTGRPRAC